MAYMHRSVRTSRQAGFTIIELLVVISLSVMITIAATGLFLSTVTSNARKDTISVVKDEGDFALSQMEFMLRNAISLVANPNNPTAPICTNGMSSITIKSLDGGITTFQVVNDRIASVSAANPSNPVYYTTTGTSITTGPTFNCTQAIGNYSSYVKINFSLQKDAVDINIPNPVKEDFTTSVTLRNY